MFTIIVYLYAATPLRLLVLGFMASNMQMISARQLWKWWCKLEMQTGIDIDYRYCMLEAYIWTALHVVLLVSLRYFILLLSIFTASHTSHSPNISVYTATEQCAVLWLDVSWALKPFHRICLNSHIGDGWMRELKPSSKYWACKSFFFIHWYFQKAACTNHLWIYACEKFFILDIRYSIIICKCLDLELRWMFFSSCVCVYIFMPGIKYWETSISVDPSALVQPILHFALSLWSGTQHLPLALSGLNLSMPML